MRNSLHKKTICLIVGVGMLFFLTPDLNAQRQPQDLTLAQDTSVSSTVIHQVVLPTVVIRSNAKGYLSNNAEAYNRLRNAVYVTYPYARKAGVILNDINAKLIGIEDKKQRKKYIKTREAQLRKEFTTPLVNLSIYQGKVLMKLINRETGNSCFEIIKEYQGGLAAGLCQTVAFFFNTSLKQNYDISTQEDKLIERIVLEVQRTYGYPEIAKGSGK